MSSPTAARPARSRSTPLAPHPALPPSASRRVPTEDRQDNWGYSALKAAELAQKKWVRVVANMRAGAYDTFESAMVLSEPVWPELSFDEVIEVAFRGRYITSLDHPVLQKLRGEV